MIIADQCEAVFGIEAEAVFAIHLLNKMHVAAIGGLSKVMVKSNGSSFSQDEPQDIH
jgi:hypothetical protein